MERNSKRILPLVIVILLLVGAVYVLYAYPSILTDLPWAEPMPEDVPTEPELPVEPEQPPVEPEQPPVEPEQPPVEPEQPPVEPESPTPVDPPSEPPTEPEQPHPFLVLQDGMYTYTQMKKDLVTMQERWPTLVQVLTYGTSVDGRDLYVVKLGNASADKQIIITSGMHAREYVNCYVIMRQMVYYLQNYETASYKGVSYRELFNDVCLVIAPMTNPDGITLALEGLEALRSSTVEQELERIARAVIGNGDIDAYLRREWKTNARGVDINRNFDALWAEHNDGVGRPIAKNYKGEMAGSEPETAALVRLTDALTNPVASLCIHMQGEVIYWRCNQTGAFEAENRRLAELAREITGYTIIDTNETEPSYSNWTILERDIPTITVENGISRYPLSYDLTEGILRKNLQLWAAVAYEYRAD